MQSMPAARTSLSLTGGWGEFVTDRTENQTLPGGSNTCTISKMTGGSWFEVSFGVFVVNRLPEDIMVNDCCDGQGEQDQP